MQPFLSPEYNYIMLRHIAEDVPEATLRKHAEDIFIESVLLFIDKLFPEKDVQSEIIGLFTHAAEKQEAFQKMMSIITKRASELSETERSVLKTQIDGIIMDKAHTVCNLKLKKQ